MAWTTPKTWTASVVTVSDLNTHIRDNLNVLKTSINDDGTLDTVFNRQVTLQTVANTVTETAVYTLSVPGGTLGTTKGLRLSLIGDQINNSGAGRTHTVRVKYGATTIFEAACSNVGNTATRSSLLLELELVAANATNAQRAKGMMCLGEGGATDTAGVARTHSESTSDATIFFSVHNAIAEDSTAAKNLVVTYQMNNANASEDMRAHTVYVEKK